MLSLEYVGLTDGFSEPSRRHPESYHYCHSGQGVADSKISVIGFYCYSATNRATINKDYKLIA